MRLRLKWLQPHFRITFHQHRRVVWSGSSARLSKRGTGRLGTGLYETIACRFSRHEGFNTDCVGHVDSREQKKDRDGCYMERTLRRLPAGYTGRLEDPRAVQGSGPFGNGRVGVVSP